MQHYPHSQGGGWIKEGEEQLSLSPVILLQLNFLKYTPLQSMLLPFCLWYFKFLGKLTQVSPPNILFKTNCENIHPPFHPLLMHTSKQMTFPHPDVFHSWVKETWGWGWETHSSVSTVYFLLSLSFLCYIHLISHISSALLKSSPSVQTLEMSNPQGAGYLSGNIKTSVAHNTGSMDSRGSLFNPSTTVKLCLYLLTWSFSHTNLTQMASEDLEYRTWVVWTTFKVLVAIHCNYNTKSHTRLDLQEGE